MKCGLNSSFSNINFGFGAENSSMKNAKLNFGAVTPPDKLPNVSLRDTISSYEYPKSSMKLGGENTLNAGKVSAGLAFSAMALSLISLLPFIRKH